MNSIPENVKVACSYQDQYEEFINPLDTTGSPYQIEVGQGVTVDNYIARDSQNRICFTSTNASALFNNLRDTIYATTSKRASIIVQDNLYYIDTPINFSGIYFDIKMQTRNWRSPTETTPQMQSGFYTTANITSVFYVSNSPTLQNCATFTNIKIVGNYTDLNWVTYGIQMSGVFNPIIENCDLHNLHTAIYGASGGDNWLISHNQVNYCNVGIRYTGSNGIIENNYVHNCSNNGIQTGALANQVLNNQVYYCSNGIQASDGIGLLIQGGQVYLNFNGLSLTRCRNATIANVLSFSNTYGVSLNAASPNICSNNTLTGNTFTNNSVDAVLEGGTGTVDFNTYAFNMVNGNTKDIIAIGTNNIYVFQRNGTSLLVSAAIP
jgi:hypothetical protein